MIQFLFESIDRSSRCEISVWRCFCRFPGLALIQFCIVLVLGACSPQEKIQGRDPSGSESKDASTEKPDGTGERKNESVPLHLPVLRVHEESVSRNLIVPGVVLALPDHFVKVSPAVAGKLVDVKVVEGQHVAKGELIAVLDDRHIKDLIAQADTGITTAELNAKQIEGNISFAKKNLERQQNLYQSEVLAQKDVLAAENQLENLQAQLESARSQTTTAIATRKRLVTELDFTRVKSPIAGVVSNRYLNAGDSSDPNTAISQVVDLENVIVNASLPADSPQEIRLRQTVNITSPSSPGQIFHGVITEISPLVDAQSNTVRVQLRAANNGWKLKEGQAVSVEIRAGSDRDAVMIPKVALVPNPDKPDQQMCYVLKGGKAKRTSVQTGSARGDLVEIVSGLKSGDQVIVRDVFGLPEDTNVEAQ